MSTLYFGYGYTAAGGAGKLRMVSNESSTPSSLSNSVPV